MKRNTRITRAKGSKTLQQWMRLIDEATAPILLNKELNKFLGTSGVSYPQGAISAYIIKKEILKGNLKAIRLEAKVRGEYLRENEDAISRERGEDKNSFYERHSSPEDKERIEKIDKEITEIKAKLGIVTIEDNAPDRYRTLQEWIFYLDSFDAPEFLQGDMNRVFNTQGVVYPIEALSAYVVKREVMRGDLNAIRLESVIRGTLNGEPPRKEKSEIFTWLDKEMELSEWKERLARNERQHPNHAHSENTIPYDRDILRNN